MKKIANIAYSLFISIILISCSSDGYEFREPVDPSVATLSKPANNTECLEVDAVKFEWNKSDNTTQYTIVIKNLITQASISQTTTSTSVEITLEKGYPYSWHIISTNTGTATATSAKWKFYLSGTPLKNHAPFPADIITPKPGQTVNLGSVQLSWSFSDIDSGDSHTFDIYLDRTDASKKIQSNFTATKKSITVTETGTYYWRVVTKDNHGANSNSGTSTFVVIE